MIIVEGGIIFDLNKITSEILDSCVYNAHTRCWCSSPSCDTDTWNCSQFASHSFLITKSTGCKNKILFVLVQGDSRGMRLLPESRAPSKHCCASYRLEVGCLFSVSCSQTIWSVNTLSSRNSEFGGPSVSSLAAHWNER